MVDFKRQCEGKSTSSSVFLIRIWSSWYLRYDYEARMYKDKKECLREQWLLIFNVFSKIKVFIIIISYKSSAEVCLESTTKVTVEKNIY